MKSNKDKIENLQKKAFKLKISLEKYAEVDPEVKVVFEKMKIIFSEIEAGAIVPPQRDIFSWYFFDVEAAEPWFIKYPELAQAEAEYSEILEDW